MTHTLTTATKTDAAPATTQTPPVSCLHDVVIHGYSGYAAGCGCKVCKSAGTALKSPPPTPPPTPVRVEGHALVLRCYVTYHSALPPALAYYAVLGQFGWVIYAKRRGKTVTLARVDGTAAKARTTEQLRLLGERWSAMADKGKDSTRTDGKRENPRRTDLDQPDPGGSRDSATDR